MNNFQPTTIRFTVFFVVMSHVCVFCFRVVLCQRGLLWCLVFLICASVRFLVWCFCCWSLCQFSWSRAWPLLVEALLSLLFWRVYGAFPVWPFGFLVARVGGLSMVAVVRLGSAARLESARLWRAVAVPSDWSLAVLWFGGVLPECLRQAACLPLDGLSCAHPMACTHGISGGCRIAFPSLFRSPLVA